MLDERRGHWRKSKWQTERNTSFSWRAERTRRKYLPSKQPRGAALKAATRGHTDIKLRERGTKRVHHFTGSISMVDKPAGGPDWLPDKIKKANVKKQGIMHLD